MSESPLERTERDVLIRIEERQERLIRDLADHLLIHCTFNKDLLTVKERQWRWGGGLAVAVFIVTLLVNVVMKSPQVRTTIVTPSAVQATP